MVSSDIGYTSGIHTNKHKHSPNNNGLERIIARKNTQGDFEENHSLFIVAIFELGYNCKLKLVHRVHKKKAIVNVFFLKKAYPVYFLKI